jgi:hypothetical protein
MEAHRLCVREATDEWAELRERAFGMVLVVAADGCSDLRLGARRIAGGRCGEEAFRGDRPQCRLRCDPAREERVGPRGRVKVATNGGFPGGASGWSASSARTADGESGSTRSASRNA